jgi:hypothetical protein
VPVATVAIGKPGATNAGVLAAQMIALADESVAARLVQYKKKLEEKVEAAARKLAAADRSGASPSTSVAIPRDVGQPLHRRARFAFHEQLAAGRADVASTASAHRHRDAAFGRGSARTRSRASSGGRVNGRPGASLSGNRFTFALMPSSIVDQRRASAGRCRSRRRAARTRT